MNRISSDRDADRSSRHGGVFSHIHAYCPTDDLVEHLGGQTETGPNAVDRVRRYDVARLQRLHERLGTSELRMSDLAGRPAITYLNQRRPTPLDTRAQRGQTGRRARNANISTASTATRREMRQHNDP